MMANTFSELQMKLAATEGLSLPYAAVLAENALYRFEPEVREGVILWMSGLLTEDFAAADTSIREIQEEIGGSMFQALCVLDILAKDPQRVEGAMWLIPEDATHAALIDNPGVELPRELI